MGNKMLKDFFKKKDEKENTKEKVLNSIADGYVEVKAYKHDKNGEKKLVYHNTGDNTITDWMRQTIMLLLSGYSLSYSGNKQISGLDSKSEKEQITKPYLSDTYHSKNSNIDGYCLNGEQYLWESNKVSSLYPVSKNSNYYLTSKEEYALFPTKILLGTGCEYSDWDSLQNDNEENNSIWYTEKVSEYGDGDSDQAKMAFNNLVGLNTIDNYQSNVYSGTVGLQGIYTGSGTILRSVTVNDPNTSTNISNSADMSKRYGVVGAIKTLYCPTESYDCSEMLETTVSDSGRLLKGKYRGAGRPCFIYFNRTNMINSNKLDWDEITSDISVQRDSSSQFLNRLTFRVIIPAQSSGTGAIGEYNPFNNYTFKQIGLFNDALFNTESIELANSKIATNMPCGTMLAIKNIQNFTKTADTSIEFTWTLTI